MSIATINVPVTASGDGPVVSISNLVGKKTVELSGRFVGRYILLGSHNDNDNNFVPVLIFDANGEESIKLTLALSLKSVRVRSQASAPSGVTMNVTGVSSPGSNLFTTLATLPPGSQGVGPIIDLNAIFPPTGVEQDINFLCSGNFDGLIVVEGSMNGINFNPVEAGFRASQQPPSLLGLPPTLEFSPLATQDLIRYVRIRVDGVVTSTVVVTMAGAVPSGISVFQTLHVTYAVGTNSLAQTMNLLDAEGGGVIVDGTSILFSGANLFTLKGATGALVTFPRTGGMSVSGGDALFLNSVGIGGSPTARLQLPAGTMAAGTAPLKITPGTLLTVTENGAVESNGAHLYWTDAGGVRLQLDGSLTTSTLAQVYANGTLSADQTLSLLDAKGGGFIVDGTAVGFTGANAFQVKSTTVGLASFPRVGGFSVVSSLSVAAAAGTTWNADDFSSSTLTLTGGPTTITSVSMAHVGQGTVNGAGNTVSDAYNLFIDDAPSGTATFTRTWALGATGAVQLQKGLVLGTGLATPGENDLVVGQGATVLSEVNSGRLGYLAGGTQKFVVSQNGGAYVPLLTSVTLAAAYAFGSVTGDQTLTLLDAKGGSFVVDGTNVGYTGNSVLLLRGSGSAVLGIQSSLQLVDNFFPTSGNASYNNINLAYSINQTGGANGTVTGILLSVTEIAVVGTHNLLDLRIGATSRFKVDRRGSLSIVQGASGIGVPTALSVVAGAHLGITASTPDPDVLFNLSASKQWSAGIVTTQLDYSILARTYTATGASTFNTAATFAISGPPTAGTNVSILSRYALLIQSGAVLFTGGSFTSPGIDTAHVTATSTLSPASGNANLSALSLVYTVSQGGSFSGTTNGLFIDSTEISLTSVHYLILGRTGGASRFQVDGYGDTTISQAALTTTNRSSLDVIAGAHLSLATTVEAIDVLFDLSAAKTWATGDITVQRDTLIKARTYVFAGASTITNAATFAISGAPIPGANATLVNSSALLVQSGATVLNGTLSVGGFPTTPPSPAQFSINLVAGAAVLPMTGPGSIYFQALFTTAGLIAGLDVDHSFWMQACETVASSSVYPIFLNPSGGGVGIGLSGSSIGNSSFRISSTITSSSVAWNLFFISQGTFAYTGVGTTTATFRMTQFSGGSISSTNAWTITDAYVVQFGTFTIGANVTNTRQWTLYLQGNLKVDGGLKWGTRILSAGSPYTVLGPGTATADHILQVTAAGAYTILLPAISTVQSGWEMTVNDSRYTAAANNITLTPNGTDKINNVAANFVMNVNGQSVTLVANATTSNWELI